MTHPLSEHFTLIIPVAEYIFNDYRRLVIINCNDTTVEWFYWDENMNTGPIFKSQIKYEIGSNGVKNAYFTDERENRNNMYYLSDFNYNPKELN